MRKGWIIGAMVLALAGCERAAAPSGETEAPVREPGAPAALSGFTHHIERDVSGRYQPSTPVTAGDHRLQHLFIGQEHAFRVWERGGRGEGLAPLIFAFADADGIVVRVRPSAYAVTDGAVRFSGAHPAVGPVTFEGDLDAGALAQSQRSLGGDGAPVLTGTLRVAGQTFETQSFSWRSGDEG